MKPVKLRKVDAYSASMMVKDVLLTWGPSPVKGDQCVIVCPNGHMTRMRDAHIIDPLGNVQPGYVCTSLAICTWRAVIQLDGWEAPELEKGTKTIPMPYAISYETWENSKDGPIHIKADIQYEKAQSSKEAYQLFLKVRPSIVLLMKQKRCKVLAIGPALGYSVLDRDGMKLHL